MKDESRYLIVSKDKSPFDTYLCAEPVFLHDGSEEYCGGFDSKIGIAIAYTDKRIAMSKCRWISKIYATLDTTFVVRTMSRKDLFTARLK